MTTPFEIFLVVPPGLEPSLFAEVADLGFPPARMEPGGVVFDGDWPDVWRANLLLRGATRVLARIGSFRAMHLAQLDKRARKFDWSLFRPELPLKVEVSCKKSRIYHAGAAKQRVENALVANGLTVAADAELVLRTRIEDDLCVFSVDTSGAALHKRGHKQAIGKAPLRETLAAHFLRMCDHDPSAPLIDPMSGSGTIPLEAAEIAAGLPPGRTRNFAFEHFASFDRAAYEGLRSTLEARGQAPILAPILGFDRDQGAVQSGARNAQAAGLTDRVAFACQAVSALQPVGDRPGLVLTNPPYGGRIGNKKLLFGLYGALGARMNEAFGGWRIGIITSEPGLAKATGLSFFEISPPIPHGGLKVKLYQAHVPD